MLIGVALVPLVIFVSDLRLSEVEEFSFLIAFWGMVSGGLLRSNGVGVSARSVSERARLRMGIDEPSRIKNFWSLKV